MEQSAPAPALSCRELFLVFFKAGLAFGGGPGIMAALEDELVRRRGVVTREDFLARYALGRVLPCGTMSAVAVAYGYRFAGFRGTVAALAGLVLPALSLIVLLTVAYTLLRGERLLDVVAAGLLPAALAFIVIAALKFGKEVFHLSPDLLLATLALGAVLIFHVHPVLIILGAGLAGLVLFRDKKERP